MVFKDVAVSSEFVIVPSAQNLRKKKKKKRLSEEESLASAVPLLTTLRAVIRAQCLRAHLCLRWGNQSAHDIMILP